MQDLRARRSRSPDEGGSSFRQGWRAGANRDSGLLRSLEAPDHNAGADTVVASELRPTNELGALFDVIAGANRWLHALFFPVICHAGSVNTATQLAGHRYLRLPALGDRLDYIAAIVVVQPWATGDAQGAFRE